MTSLLNLEIIYQKKEISLGILKFNNTKYTNNQVLYI